MAWGTRTGSRLENAETGSSAITEQPVGRTSQTNWHRQHHDLSVPFILAAAIRGQPYAWLQTLHYVFVETHGENASSCQHFW
jgi:hypothetical protein